MRRSRRAARRRPRSRPPQRRSARSDGGRLLRPYGRRARPRHPRVAAWTTLARARASLLTARRPRPPGGRRLPRSERATPPSRALAARRPPPCLRDDLLGYWLFPSYSTYCAQSAYRVLLVRTRPWALNPQANATTPLRAASRSAGPTSA